MTVEPPSLHPLTREATAHWATRHEAVPDWAHAYWTSAHLAHRRVVLDVLEAAPDWDSLLELGCNAGPNLRLIRQAWPLAELVGLDVNEAALAEARAQRAQGALARVGLLQGTIPEELMGWPSQSVDVVLSVYALAYVAPEDLMRTLFEAQRIARTALVLAEPMPAPDLPTGQIPTAPRLEWCHDYAARLTAWGCRVRIWPVTPPADALNAVLLAEVAR